MDTIESTGCTDKRSTSHRYNVDSNGLSIALNRQVNQIDELVNQAVSDVSSTLISQLVDNCFSNTFLSSISGISSK